MNNQIIKFVESNISDDFGLTVEQVAQQCRSYGRFSAWLNSDVSRIIEVLNVVKNNGVSPAFFASYERTEGYNSSWGWLNHTTINGTPTQDANSVSQWIVSQSRNMTDNPAWIDYANYKDFVPTSVKQEGNAHFQGLPSGSIGRVVISGTAAATWEVYYPLGLLAEYNGVQDYGKPLTNMMVTIEQWGGTIEGGGTGGKPHFPTTEGLTITSPYGWRSDPFTGERVFHDAIDIGGGGINHPIYATQSGVVVANYYRPESSGYGIEIQHTGDSYWSRYVHLAEQSPLSVGTSVQKGQQIGVMGTTGYSTGIHLDFAISINGDWYNEANTMDPEVYLNMDFGGGEGPIEAENDYITLLLVDALAGWKW